MGSEPALDISEHPVTDGEDATSLPIATSSVWPTGRVEQDR